MKKDEIEMVGIHPAYLRYLKEVERAMERIAGIKNNHEDDCECWGCWAKKYAAATLRMKESAE